MITTTTELVPLTPELPPTLPVSPTSTLLEHWLSGRSPRTVRAYCFDLNDFTKHLHALTMAAAVAELLGHGPARGNELALGYRNALLARGLASATVARRLAALRSLVVLARTLGLVAWDLSIRPPRIEARRDVRGPDPGDRRKLWRFVKRLHDDRRTRRDRAIIAL